MMETAADEEVATKIKADFRVAKSVAIALGYTSDLYPGPSAGEFGEADLLREGAWVILCTGFRERTVRRIFRNISICFCNWISARCIVDGSEVCRETALDVFRNERKIDAILGLAKKIDREGFETIRQKIEQAPILALKEFTYIGPITAFHFAKNLGFQMAKPDRHLQRLAERNGYSDVHELCSLVAEITREPISVVDGVLWRLSESGLVNELEIFDLTSIAKGVGR